MPLLHEPGLLNTRAGGDSPFLLQRLHQLETALRDGHFPVRWMPDANYGYGYPFFNYYAPLSIYIAAAFRFLGFNYVRAIHLAQLSGFLVAGWGMYHLARRWWGTALAGVLAAAAYTFAPFHLVNIYVRGDSLAEFWAMAFYPLVFLAVEGVLNQGQLSPHPQTATEPAGKSFTIHYSQFLFALVYAALILSHNISALIFTPFLLLYLLFRVILSVRQNAFSTHTHSPHSLRLYVTLITPLILNLGFALVLALALSAWFWLPALGEQNLAQLGPVTEGYFHYSQHFRGRDLIQPSFFFLYTTDNPFRMGLVQALLTGAGGITCLWYSLRPQKNSLRRGLALVALTCLGLATFMITPASQFLWDHLPLLPFTQFPWRFLSVQAFAAALVIASLAGSEQSTGGNEPSAVPHHAPLTIHQSRLTILFSLFALLILLYSALGRLPQDFLYLSDADITAERLAQYEWFTGNIGSTISAEYLPFGVRPRPYSSDWLVSGERDHAIIQGAAAAVIQERTTDRQIWQINVTANSTATITLPTLYWPGWQAKLADNTPLELHAAAGSGLIQFTLPGGTHTLTLRLTRPPLRLSAELISLIALLLVITLTIKQSGKTVLPLLRYTGGVLGLLLLLLIVARLLKPTPSNLNQSWDFAQMAYLHPSKTITFANGAQLTHYEMATETRAGTPWEITLWLTLASATPMSGTIQLVTPALYRFAAAPSLISYTQPLHEGANQFRLTLPENAPPGLYLPQFSLNNAAALTPSGQTRVPLLLQPLRLTNPIPHSSPSTDLAVQAVTVRPRPTRLNECPQPHGCLLDIQLAWLTPTPLTQNLGVSLVLTQANGEWLEQFDTQPGYGYLPSTAWPPATWVNDWLTMPLPAAAPPYTLVVRLYEVDGVIRLTRRLGTLSLAGETLVFQANQPVYVLPEEITALDVRLGDAAALRGYQLNQANNQLEVTLYWQALTSSSTEYRHFIHLMDPTTGQVVVQHDAQPVNNSYPTSQWTPNEIVTDAAALSLENIPPGKYQLVIGLYHQATDGSFPRLLAQNPDGSLWPNNAISLVPITIP